MCSVDSHYGPDFDPGTGLGPRLRLVRGSRQLSVRELARRVGCSASLISQIERGVSVPSVGVLYSLATELGSSLDYLLFGSGAGADGVPAVAGGGVLRLGARGGRAAARDRAAGLRSPDHRPGQRRALGAPHRAVRRDDRLPRGDLPPGGHSTDERRPLRHDGREYGLIISGTLQANVGFESYELGPGDSIAFDSSTPHEYLNKTGDYVHAIWVVVHSEPGRA